jgi:hypothetical protein
MENFILLLVHAFDLHNRKQKKLSLLELGSEGPL